ncbi:MAG: tungstate ABC transporter substrate-binding protein WtpA [Bacillota bacterium]
MKKIFIFILLILSFILFPLHNYSVRAKENQSELIIFHAGSLSVPFSELEKNFEAKYPNVNIIREIAGSRKTVRKVTDLGRTADIIASADYSVIENLMIPKYADWYLNFATNEMVIMYTKNSQYRAQINDQNWYRILLREDVEYGHSDPDADPCGYRSKLIWHLAEKYYNENKLYSKLESNCPQKNIRPKETDLIALLELGELDYIFIYKSIAQQHKFPFVELPDKINLKTNKYADFYKQAEIEISGSKPGLKTVKKGEPMIYGLTIPKNSNNFSTAQRFIKFLISEEGQKIIEKNGQSVINPSIVNDLTKIPQELKKYVKEEK